MSEEIKKLIEKFLSRTISGEESNKLLNAYQEKRINKKQFNSYYAGEWENAGQSPSPEAEKSRKKVWKQVRSYIHPHMFSLTEIKSRWIAVAGIAAVAILFFALGYSIRLTSAYSAKELVVIVGNGQKANVRLPDGSHVNLNSASELRYPSDFGKKERTVKLKGEAYFDVESNPNSPFIVQASSNLQVKALGTKFNVKSYPDDTQIISTLIEGTIEVSSPEWTEVLTQGEQIQFHTRDFAFSKSSVENVDEAIFWMTGQFVFDKETLENIGKILERMYNVSISFSTPDIKEIQYSGKIKNNSMENVLNLITVVSPLQYTMTGSHITFSKK